MFKILMLIFVLLFSMPVMVSGQAAELVDPTRPLGYRISGKGAEAALKLQAIFYGKGRKEAIVSGVAVKEGGWVHGKKIVRIGPNEIEYKTAKGTRTLKLRPSIFKK